MPPPAPHRVLRHSRRRHVDGASRLPSAAPESSAPLGVPSIAVVASIPPENLLFADKLVVCSDMPYPPQEYFDASGNPIGSDIEIAQGIAARVGLRPRS